MSDWGWVALAYLVTYGTLITYAVALARRVRRSERGRT